MNGLETPMASQLERVAALEPELKALVGEENRPERIRCEVAVQDQCTAGSATSLPLWGTLVGIRDIFHVDGLPTRAGSLLPSEVLAGEQLSSLELSEGLIRIQGTSSDPQAILQRLEQDPLFTEVVFSRATSNTRYYIDLRLATVNFEAYRVRHCPDET